jgi:hypothetical protein
MPAKAKKKAAVARRYPAVPKVAEAPGGPVTVKLVDKLVHRGDECWGLYDPAERTISIDRTASKQHQWRIYYHEWAHAGLCDAGLDNALTEQLNEAICDALATARMRERFG